jgi:hypothetical protein
MRIPLISFAAVVLLGAGGDAAARNPEDGERPQCAAPTSAFQVAQSSERLGRLRLDGTLGRRGRMREESDSSGVFRNAPLTGSGVGSYRGRGLGRYTGRGLGVWTGGGMGAMHGGAVGHRAPLAID